MEASRQKVGVVIAQLGTPNEPTAKGLRPYLRQFLSDRRVIDYHPLLWQPILRGIILRARPPRSAKLYQRIWLKEGSPLLVYAQRQTAGIQARLGSQYAVILGMTYGQPSITNAVRELEAQSIQRIIVLPMFPQFSSTTTASIYDAVYAAAAGERSLRTYEHKRFVPTLRFIEPYYDHPLYIDAMKTHLSETIAALPHKPDHYVITYHGIPNRYVQSGDPYRAHCEQTAQLLANVMGWDDRDWQISFQSRFGPEPWLEPYTDAVLQSLRRNGVERPLVFSPGFVTDCLETLDELGHGGREQFEAGGGYAAQYHLAPCLNDHPRWLDALAELIRQNVGGWVNESSSLPIEREVLEKS